MSNVTEKSYDYTNMVLCESVEIGSFMANRMGFDPIDTGIIVDPVAIGADGIPDAENIYVVYSLPNEVVCEKVMEMLNYLEAYGYNLARITYL